MNQSYNHLRSETATASCGTQKGLIATYLDLLLSMCYYLQSILGIE